MPPKIRFTREDIIEAAIRITREKGIEAVVAREVAKELGCTVSPIFTAFTNMDELKSEVYNKAKELYVSFFDGIMDYRPVFKEFGVRMVNFANQEPNLYKLLFNDIDNNGPIYTRFAEEFSELFSTVIPEIKKTFEISTQDADELFNHMIIYSNGIAHFCLDGQSFLSDELVNRYLSEACIGTVMVIKLKDGSFDEKTAKDMISEINQKPHTII